MGLCKLNRTGMKNWRFSTNISHFENGTRYGHSYYLVHIGTCSSLRLELKFVFP